MNFTNNIAYDLSTKKEDDTSLTKKEDDTSLTKKEDDTSLTKKEDDTSLTKKEDDTSLNDAVEEPVKLCENMDCERYPPDWDFEEDTEENYEDGQQWVKCNLCDGYFNDDGMGDILFIEEEPNNKTAQCDLCGKDNDIIQMKGTGQFLCGNACDDEDSI